MAQPSELNYAAYLPSKQARPFQIKEAPMPLPKSTEVIIHVKAIASVHLTPNTPPSTQQEKLTSTASTPATQQCNATASS